MYRPESVADAILHAATTPVRDLYVGSGARMIAAMDRWAPRMTDRALEKMLIPGTHSGEPRRGGRGLYEPSGDLQVRGRYPGLVRRSVYTHALVHPMLAVGAAAGIAALVAELWQQPIRRTTARVRGRRRPVQPASTSSMSRSSSEASTGLAQYPL